MRVPWLAALLSPRDVAPHPNFRRAEVASAEEYEQLALVLIGNAWWQQQRISLGQLATHEVRGFARAAERAVTQDTYLDGLRELRDLLKMELGGSPKACAIAVFYSATAYEADLYIDLLDALNFQLQCVTGQSTESHVWRALLLLQLSFRNADAGIADSASATEAFDILKQIDWNDIGPLEVDGGVGRPSSVVYAEIGQALMQAALSQLDSESVVELRGQTDRAWVQSVRQGIPTLVARNYANALEPYRQLAEEAVWFEVGGRGFRPRTQTDDLFFQLLALEIFANRAARQMRSQLAVYRLARALDADDATFADDCIRLLRHSMDLSKLESMIIWYRQNGPLDVLGTDARRIIFDRLSPCDLRTVELEVLGMAADVLSADECRSALSRLIVHGSFILPPELPGHYSVTDLRHAAVVKAALRLAKPAGQQAVVLDALIELLANYDEDSLLDQELARILYDITWDNLNTKAVRRWTSYLEQRTTDFPQIVEAWNSSVSDDPRSSVLVVARQRSAQDYNHIEAVDDGLNGIANRLNSLIAGRGFSYAGSDIFVRDIEKVRDALSEMVTAAHDGRHSVGAVDPADLVAVFIATGNVKALWPDLLSFYSDPAILRREKQRSLERIVRDADSSQLRDNDLVELAQRAWSTMLNDTNDFSILTQGPFIKPFPAGLRFALFSSIVGSDEATAYLSQSLSSKDVAVRREAAHTILSAARNRSFEQWWVPLALLASYDRDARVRSFGAAAVVRNRAVRSNQFNRVHELAQERGVDVPLAILTNWGFAGEVARFESLNKLIFIFLSHPSRLIREKAQEISAHLN